MVHTFPKGISPKVNAVVQLEFKFAYFEAGVQNFSHYARRLLTAILKKKRNIEISSNTLNYIHCSINKQYIEVVQN